MYFKLIFFIYSIDKQLFGFQHHIRGIDNRESLIYTNFIVKIAP